MKKLLLATALLFGLVTPASAGLPQHPAPHQQTSFSTNVICDRATFKTHSVPNRGNIVITASVSGHPIQVISGSGGHTLYLSGRGVLIQVSQDPKRVAPLVVRVASVRRSCARVNVLAVWG